MNTTYQILLVVYVTFLSFHIAMFEVPMALKEQKNARSWGREYSIWKLRIGTFVALRTIFSPLFWFFVFVVFTLMGALKSSHDKAVKAHKERKENARHNASISS